jgi:hypothetical protein
MSMKNSCDTIGNRSRDLLVCSVYTRPIMICTSSMFGHCIFSWENCVCRLYKAISSKCCMLRCKNNFDDPDIPRYSTKELVNEKGTEFDCGRYRHGYLSKTGYFTFHFFKFDTFYMYVWLLHICSCVLSRTSVCNYRRLFDNGPRKPQHVAHSL